MKFQRSWLAGPALLWFLFFIALPLVLVALVSFAHRGTYGGIEWQWSVENYFRLLTGNDVRVLWQSFVLAALTTVSCVILGTLVAWAIATAPARQRSFYVAALALPFLTNLVIRIYALKVLVGNEGPLQALLNGLGLHIDPFAFSQNPFLVFYGMVTTYLPFFVFPLYGAFEKFDFSLVEAAQDLGAGPWKILFTVIVPNLSRALRRASLLVFIPALGEYVIPDLLGGARTLLFGNLIAEQFLKARDWPQGAALAVTVILIVAVLSVWLLSRAERKA